MRMKAQVVVINQVRDMYAAEIEGQNEFIIFELLDSLEPDIGDVLIHHNFCSIGEKIFKNITQGCSIKVFVEDICGANLINQRCLL